MYVRSELDNVKGKNDKQIEGRRKSKLRRLLQDKSQAKFREPVATA